MEDQRESITPYQWGLAASGLAVAVLGCLGWAQVSPRLPLDEVIYRGVTMLALQYEFPFDRTPPPLLNVARFTALVWAAAAVLAVLGRVFGSRLRVRRAEAATNHVVLAGTGQEVPALALRYRRDSPAPRVIVIGDVEQETALQLRRGGVVLLPAASHETLSRILQGASRVVVADRSDPETARLASRVESAAGTAQFPSVVLFDKGDMTRQWNRNDGHTALCRNTQLAIALLRTSPPRLEDLATPPPVVISEGDLGSEIVTRIVVGWQQLGERLPVHCFGRSNDWVDEVSETMGQRCALTFDRIPHSVDAVTQIVQRRVATWQAPPAKKATVSGPTVVIALGDATVGVPMAIALADQMTAARVSVLVDDASIWAPRLATLDRPPRLVSRLDQLAEPAVLELTPERLLRDELFADAARWPQDVPSILGEFARDETGRVRPLDDQPPSVREAVDALAGAARAILAEGNLETSNCLNATADSPMLSPSELAAMADALLAALPGSPETPVGNERRWRALETASRLPTLVARAGWAPRRPAGYAEAIPAPLVASLAERAHEMYLEVAEQTSNATGSEVAELTWAQLSAFDQESNRAQVVDIPLKLAAMGYDWRPAESPALVEFGADEVEQMAELEHRRWEFFQRRNGRPGHQWAVPWAQLDDDQRKYDREPVRRIPQVLASIGLEVVDRKTPLDE